MQKRKYILVTGGLGYIGSHILKELHKNNLNFIILDNLSNSNILYLDNIKKALKSSSIIFKKIDIRDKEKLENLFKKYSIEGVIHLAGLKSVNESIEKPLEYYENNVCGTINLLKIMEKYSCYNLIFSSSATVYGIPNEIPVKENMKTGENITNPYGKTKYMIEEILKDLFNSNNKWQIIILRYFNPVGQDKSGYLYEEPKGIPNNLMPYIIKVYEKKLPELKIYGNDYPTKDGTGVRDFIHISDLANAHVKAYEYLKNNQLKNVLILNVGTGKGYSVLEILKTFEEVNKTKIPYKIVDRRPGDIAEIYADNSKIKEILKWEPKYNLEDMVKIYKPKKS